MAPGTVETMTTSPAGQVALIVAGALFAGGFLAIRRMTRIDL
jgi:Flp pilus assembly protein TadB